ncbi:MAG: nickel-dependent hydrogenase large subunit [Deltaproteobacteria bacterium]|nr:MAG: nickel-dependent hydrogenase large subunit [Deltaproteobacteria bacterium]
MAKKLVIDPIPRIEGHLRIEVEIENGKVKEAWSSGTLFRGFEILLKGRDPRDAWFITQRICGVCPVSHGHTSTLGLENAFGVTPPENALLVRNLIEGGQFVHSHILWFYHLNALDYVDVVSALKARPTSSYLKQVQGKLKAFVDSGQLGPFENGYWGHPEYKLPPELNLLAVAHYLEALEMQKKASHLVGILGGKMPMHMTTPPGGTTWSPRVDQLDDLLFRIREIKQWVDTVFIPDVLAIAPYYLKWANIGKGHLNFLSWGVFEDPSFDPKKRLLPRGAVFGGQLEVKDVGPAQIKEYVDHSWFEADSGNRNPAEGKTLPKFTGFHGDGKYSWLKAPRIDDHPMEVGALSRILVAYLSGNEKVKKLVDFVLKELGVAGKPQVLLSVLGRIAARVVETKVVIDAMEEWTLKLIENIKSGKTQTYALNDVPEKASGVGLWEAPRGALAHFNEIEGKKLKNYQCVVPTTWNASPRDHKGQRGPIEEALIGTPVHDPDKPLEILRVVHSFDPCIACAVHVIHPETNEVKVYRVV